MAKKQAEPAPEPTEEADLSQYASKAPTDLQTRFAAWIVDKLELTFGSKKEEAAFREGVRLGTAMRMVFQASPENQAALEAARTAAEEKKAERAAAPKKATGRPKKSAATPEPEPEPEPAAKPAKKAAKRATPARRAESGKTPAPF